MSLTRPFLKWAGGKYRLLDRLLPSLPAGSRLVEPFVGSGAVFLNAAYPAYLLCDLNPDLIGLYETLRREGERFIKRARALFTPENNTREAFLRLRAAFNASTDAEERAVLFLYLNRHAYNGLVRYNARGVYNVPFGRYKAPYFPAAELTAFVRKMRDCDVTFAVQDFRRTFPCCAPEMWSTAIRPMSPPQARPISLRTWGEASAWPNSGSWRRRPRPPYGAACPWCSATMTCR